MKGKEFKRLANQVHDDAEVLIGENPKSLLIINNEVCTMIKLDGKWDYTKKELEDEIG